jgi:hypothetical protein
METLIEEKVKEFTTKVSTYKPIELGSDEHLDYINRHRKPIVFITDLLSKLTASLRAFYNADKPITKDDIKLLDKTVSLNARFYAARRQSKNYPYFKEALKAFNEQRELHKELVHDFKHFRLESQELNELKDKLKSLDL